MFDLKITLPTLHSLSDRLNYLRNSKIELEKRKITWAAVAKAAGVSPRLVCNMRDVQKRLGEEVGVYRHWWAAREAAEGRTGRPLSDDEREARVDEMAEVYAERMFKTFGTKLSANLPISARALKRYHGNRTRGLVHQLKTLTEWELDEFSDDVNSDF